MEDPGTPLPATAVLRVAADPDNLPFSNARLEGFENRIVALLADEIGATVEYVWLPTYRGSLRQSFREAGCQVVAAVPRGADRALTTEPYYRSGYVFVYRSDRDLALASLDDPGLGALRIGVQMTEVPATGSTPEEALMRRGLGDNVHRYRPGAGGDSGSQILDALARGEIDTAILWGPLAGYLAQRYQGSFTLSPITPGTQFDDTLQALDVCVGIQGGEYALRDAIDQALTRRRAEIEGILKQFGVPSVTTVSAGY